MARDPGHLQEVDGGLNKMTLGKFERIIRASGRRITDVRLFPTLGVAEPS